MLEIVPQYRMGQVPWFYCIQWEDNANGMMGPNQSQEALHTDVAGRRGWDTSSVL
jgi:hypothetical protein